MAPSPMLLIRFFFIMFEWRDRNFVCAVAHNGSEKYNILHAHVVELFLDFFNIKSLDHSVT